MSRHLIVDGVPYQVDFDAISDQPVFSLLVDGKSYESYVYPSEEGWQVLLHGTLYQAIVEDERERRLRAALGSRVADREEFHLRAPMPGLVVAIPVNEGAARREGRCAADPGIDEDAERAEVAAARHNLSGAGEDGRQRGAEADLIERRIAFRNDRSDVMSAR